MRSFPRASLHYFFTFLTLVSGVEYHAGHQAVHQTMLWHRSRSEKQASGNADDSAMNMSTAIVDYRSEYAGVIGVGTNSHGSAQFQAQVVFDTGSDNLWVASRLCTTCEKTWKERATQFYDPQKSTTQEEFLDMTDPSLLGRDIDIQFGTARLQGPLHVDTFRVGPFELKKQPFAMMREMNGFQFEGIVGLAFQDMSMSSGLTPFFDRVIQQKLLKNNEFAFFMNVDSTKPSALLWGGVDKSLYQGEIQMFPVVQPHYWALELVDLLMGETSMVGNKSMYSMKGGAPVNRLIVDSGTTFYTAPAGLHAELIKQIPPANCDKVMGYPDLTYMLRSGDGELAAITVSVDAYMIRDASNNCESGIMPFDVDEHLGPAMIFGKTFLQRYFTVFSRGNGDVKDAKVGFAAANLDATPKVIQNAAESPSFLQNEDFGSDTRSVTMDSRAQMRSKPLRRKIQEH